MVYLAYLCSYRYAFRESLVHAVPHTRQPDFVVYPGESHCLMLFCGRADA